MSINLAKGEKIDLRKSNPGLSKILVGLGWDPVSASSGGFFKKLVGMGAPDIDCDASVFMLDSNGALGNVKDFIYFANLKSRDNSVIHTGDNLTGDGAGDDEQILVDLDSVPGRIEKLLFIVNIYDCIKRNQDFGMIKNAFIRVVDQKSGKEIVKYNLSDNYADKTTLVVGCIFRKNGSWEFEAIGEGYKFASLTEVLRNLSSISF
ncbi:MAG: TerD family protein [Clostridioides sp.]|jgi:stress response protein SCP2|nr:TerD family protein [Clostridioides sp.]